MTDTKKIVAAMSTAETGVEPPNRQRSSSFTAVIADLIPGEHCSKVLEIDSSHTLATVSEHMPTWRQELRNNVTPSVRNARARTGGEYTIEVGEMTTGTRRLFLVAVVTRTA